MRVYRAVEKLTGFKYIYCQRRTYGRTEFQIPTLGGRWFPKLSEAKAAAKSAGQFRYDHEPPVIRVVA